MSGQLSIFDQLDRIHGDTLSREEDAILSFLAGHKGRAAAVTSDVMAAALKMDKERIRHKIAHLVDKHDILIGSVTEKPGGFYIPVTAEESDATADNLMHRGLACLKRAAKIRKVSLKEIMGMAELTAEASAK